jgi:hypothetical protein
LPLHIERNDSILRTRNFALIITLVLGINLLFTSSHAEFVAGVNPELVAKGVTYHTSYIAKHEKQKGRRKLPKYVRNGYNEQDVRTLAQCIFGESGYCSYTLKLYVGSVVYNRTKDSRFPNTIEEVVYQQGQYSPVGSPIWYTTPNEDSFKAAREILSNGSALPSNVVWQANFKQGNGVYCTLETMYFCY